MSAAVEGACDACLARSWLLARLGGHLEHSRARIESMLALDDGALLDAVGGEHTGEIAGELERLDLGGVRSDAAGSGVQTLCRCDPRYPARLRDLEAPPAVLHVLGGLERFLALSAGDPVAIVGSRRASSYGLEAARSLGQALVAAGLPVLSGMALGVDSAAHSGALDACAHGGALELAVGSGVPDAAADTIAVLPGPVTRAYPASKRSLHRRIASAGSVISELPAGAGVWRWTFTSRNRIIAALAAVTVVVEAGARSGSLVTAAIARRLERPVLAVPGRITSPLAQGTNDLLAGGAKIARGAQDVLDALYGIGVREVAGNARPALEARLEGLLEALAGGESTATALWRAGLGVEEGLAALAELELSGYVRRGAGGRYSVIV